MLRTLILAGMYGANHSTTQNRIQSQTYQPMKSKLSLLISCLAFAAVLCGNSARADSIAYSSTENAWIEFNGASQITFTPASNNFMLTASGLLGEITGTFTIGAVTPVAPGIASAPVNGVGAVTIHDGSLEFTAKVDWDSITEIGAGGGLNMTAEVNMWDISYSGLNADLLAMVATGHASNVLTFQFGSPVSLAALKLGAPTHSTSFSGTMTAVPDGGTVVMLLGIGFSGLALIRRRFLA